MNNSFSKDVLSAIHVGLNTIKTSQHPSPERKKGCDERKYNGFSRFMFFFLLFHGKFGRNLLSQMFSLSFEAPPDNLLKALTLG
jgi:hypothetical protein